MVWEGFPYCRKQKHTHPFHMKTLWTISKKNHNGIVKKKKKESQCTNALTTSLLCYLLEVNPGQDGNVGRIHMQSPSMQQESPPLLIPLSSSHPTPPNDQYFQTEKEDSWQTPSY